MNTNDLYSAKRHLDKAHRALQDYILKTYRNDPAHCVNGYLAGPMNEIYSCHPTTANKKKFVRLAESIVKQASFTDDFFRGMINTQIMLYDEAINLAQAEKDRKIAKRAAVQAKRDQRKELNLGEKVNLAGVDVGQYKVTLEGLEPVRVHVYEVTKKNLEDEAHKLDEILTAFKHDALLYNPYDADLYYKSESWRKVHRHKTDLINRWFVTKKTDHSNKTRIVVLRQDFRAFVIATAKRAALDYIQGYAVKLAGKVGEVVANTPAYSGFQAVKATVNTPNLWSDSIAVITIAPHSMMENAQLAFRTQVIWNRSCLGNPFNQWPTRLVK